MNEEKSSFVIDSDAKAEWAVGKIRESQEERDRLLALITAKREELDRQEKEIRLRHDTETDFLRYQLEQYMKTVKCKSTKTQDSYQLLSGKLVRKHAGFDIQRDDATLCKWLEGNGRGDLVKVTTAPKWGEFKKLLDGDPATGMVFVAETGELVDGLTAVQTPEAFDIKFN